MRRPLPLVALLYAAGIVLAHYLAAPLTFLMAGAMATALGAIFLSRGRGAVLVACLVLTGWTNLAFHNAVLAPDDLRRVVVDDAEIVTLQGTLVDTPEQRVYFREEKPSWRTLAQIDVTSVARRGQWQPACGRIVATTPGLLEAGFQAGQPVRVLGLIETPRGPQTPGAFDYRTYLRHLGIYHLLRVERTRDWQLVGPQTDPVIPPWSERFLTWAKATLAQGMPTADEPLRLLWAMVLGWKTALTNEVAQPFMRSGTLHVFAISGLHIALLAGLLVSVLRLLQVPRTVCGLVVIPLLWCYTAATGWQASAIRSTVMMTIIIGGWALRRPSDLLNSLAASGLVILLFDPRQLFQAGFQLSFFVVLGLALISPPLERFRQWLLRRDPLLPDELRPRWQRAGHAVARYVTAGIATSLAAWLGSLPLIAYYFYMVTPVSLLANLLIVPLSSAALAASLGSLFCGDWLPAFTVPFNHCAWLFMKWMIDLSEWSAALPGAYFYLRPPDLLEFAIYYTLLAALLSGWVLREARWRWAVPAFALACGVAGAGPFQRRHDLEIIIPPLAGSGLFIDGPGRNSDLLIDASDDSGAERTLGPMLRAKGVNRLPRVLLTHGDQRHSGGYAWLAREFTLAETVTSASKFRSPAYREIVRQLETHPERWRRVQRGDHIGAWRVLSPPADHAFPQADDNAVALLGEFHSVRVALLSDLGRPGQDRLLTSEADLRADIVVASYPTHGEPLLGALLERIQPQVIILAGASFPASARASRSLLERLETDETPVLCTERTGAVTIRIRPSGWEITTMNGARLTGKP